MMEVLVSHMKRRMFCKMSDPFVMSFSGSFHFWSKINDYSTTLFLMIRRIWNKNQSTQKIGCQKGPGFTMTMFYMNLTLTEMLLDE